MLQHCGIGLRAPHHAQIQRESPAIPWLEVHSENFFAAGGSQIELLDRLRRDYPLSLHGVGLSLGSADGIDVQHLQTLRTLVQRVEPALVSEHLCWGAFGGLHSNDLLPLPYTHEALQLMTTRVGQLQETLGRRVLIENVSSYLEFSPADYTEWDFIAALAARSGCALLLDVNNIYVNARNHGFDAAQFLRAIPISTVAEIHLAGHSVQSVDSREIRIDTHNQQVCQDVWDLYAQAVRRFGSVPTLIEWDADIPALDTLRAEAARADMIATAVMGGSVAPAPAPAQAL